jgi:hypothetical protein
VCEYTACSDPQPDYALGASVDARWGSTFYSGKIGTIRNVCGRCSYDVHFDDGDKKYGVVAANIRPKEKSNGVGLRFKAVQAKPTGAKAAKAKAEKKNDEREKEDNNGESGASGESGSATPAPPAPAADGEEFKPNTDAEDRHEGWASKVHATIQPEFDYKGNSGGAPRFQEQKTGAADKADKEGASGSSGAAEQPFKVPTDAEDRHDGWANKVHATVVPGGGKRHRGRRTFGSEIYE